MKTTECCNLRFIGDNHSPIQPDGYCLHCGFHPEIESLKAEIGIYKANERLARQRNEELQKENEELDSLIVKIRHTIEKNHPEYFDDWIGEFVHSPVVCLERVYLLLKEGRNE